MLADERRRRVLFALLSAGPDDDVSSLLIDEHRSVESTRVQVSLEHVHLPKLAEAGLIDWDRTRNEVTRGPAFEDIRPLLELLESYEDRHRLDRIES